MVALADAAAAEFAAAHGKIKRRRIHRPRARPARRRGADPCLGPRPHLSVRCAATAHAATAPNRSVATDYYNRLASRVTAALSVGTAAGPLYDVDTRLRPARRQGHARGVARRLRRLSAGRGLDLGAYGADRARAVYGSAEARAKLAAILDTILDRPRDSAKTRCRRRGDARRDDAAQAAGRTARHQARARAG